MGLDRAIDITVGQRKTVLALLERHLPNTAAWVYGSRAKWTSRPQSDLDLVVFATPEQNGRVSDLREAFEESDLPFRVDLFVWDTVPEKFRKQIKRDHVALRPVETPNERGQRISGQWPDVVLSNIIDLIGGGTPKRSTPEYWNGAIPWLSVKDFNHDLRHVDISERSITEFGLTKSSTTLLPKGHLIISARGTVGAISQLSQPMAFNQSCYGIRAKSEYVTNDFLYYLIRHSINKFKRMTHGAVFDTITRETFQHINVKLPTFPEQRAIAHILGTLDDKIELNRRMNETLEAMARALFKSWFVDFDPVRAKMEGRDPCLPEHLADLFPDRMEDSELGEIPKGWEAKALGECVNLTMGQSPPGSTYNEQGEGLPFFQGRSDFGFRYPENRKFCTAPTRIADPEDTLVSVRAPVGDINMAWERCCIGRGVAALRHKSDTMSFSYYSTWTIQSVLQEYEHTGTVFGAVNKSQFEALRVIEPNPNIVEAFDSCARPLDARIRSNIAESRALAALRDALLPKLISGDLRVKSTEAFLERVL